MEDPKETKINAHENIPPYKMLILAGIIIKESVHRQTANKNVKLRKND